MDCCHPYSGMTRKVSYDPDLHCHVVNSGALLLRELNTELMFTTVD